MSDFIKSDYCRECDGTGSVTFISHQTEEYIEHETEQCEECERLYGEEIRADILHDRMKEGDV